MQHMKRQHYRVPRRVLCGSVEHDLPRIAGRGLGDTEKAEFPGLPRFQQRGDNLGTDPVIIGRRDSVKLEDIDVIQPQPSERAIQAIRDFLRGQVGARGFGADDDAVPRHGLQGGADDILGVVDGGGVDQGDALVKGLADDANGVFGGLTRAEAKAAETAAAQTGDADFKAGAA